MKRRPAEIATTLLCLFGIVFFSGLGVWQIERRAWKLDLIAQVDTRLQAAPVPAPGPTDWPHITAAHDSYRRVTITGRFINDAETLVQAVTERGPGFWVMTPLRADQGFIVLINRGFVPLERRDPATRAAGQIDSPVAISGLLRVSEPKGGFLRRNAPAEGRWYSRDVAAIAIAHHFNPVQIAPYFIDADSTPNPGGFPAGGLTVVAFRNSHLAYAITWFSLALLPMIWLVLKCRREGDD